MKLVMKWSATSQGKLPRVCLETTVRYDCICKKKVHDSIKDNIQLGPSLQYIKLIGKPSNEFFTFQHFIYTNN
jgi:hypothetical protein